MPLTGTTIPVFDPPTSAVWPTTFAGFTNVGNGINPNLVSTFTPGPSVPTNPYASGSVTVPSGQSGILAGTTATLNVTATPGTTPTSTAMAVTINLSAIGGSAAQSLTPISATTFSQTLSVPANQPGGVYNLPLSVTDAQGRTGGGSVRFTIIGLPPANYFAETEPNDTGKTQAQPVTLALSSQLSTNPGAFRGVWGVTTGSTITNGGGLTTSDNYRFKIAPRPLGIYRNTLSIESPTIGHAATIRGLNQTGGVIGTNDSIVQSSVGATIRTSSWFGFGKQEEFFYRITGGAATGADYRVTYDSQEVIPATLSGGNPAPGNISIARAGGNAQTMAFWLFDSALNPIPGGGAQSLTTQTITRSVSGGGPYYMAVALSNVATNQPAPADSPSRATPVTDFANLAVGASSTSSIAVGNLDLVMTDSVGGQWTLNSPLGEMSSHKIYWFRFYVGPQVNPSLTGSSSPFPVIASNDPALALQGGYSTDLNVSVTPGDLPPSTGISVTANLSAFGGSSSQPLDGSGTAFTYSLRVPASQSSGDYSVPVTATDAQGRTATGGVLVRVLATPPPAAVLEVEPNDTLVGSNSVQLAPGDSIYGYSTGALLDTSNGVANTSDFFLIQTSPAALGIYQNRLSLTSSGPAGHTGSIRGRQQIAGSVNPFDVFSTFQTSASGYNQWYSFGRGETVEYRVAGGPGTTGAYVATFTRTPVTPIVVAGSIASGSVTIQRGAGNSFSPAMWVYDSTLQPIGSYGSQGLAPLTRTFAPGTYYLAISDVSTANDQSTPLDSSDLNNTVLGRPDQLANNSTAAGTMSVQFSHEAGSNVATGVKSGPFDVVWYQFTVANNASAGACCLSNGSCVGSTQASCAGVFQGVGTVCSAVTCPIASTVACCRGATCAVTTVANCVVSSGNAGAFASAASSCNVGSSSFPCCYADYNKVSGVTVQDIFDFLNDWFSGSVFATTGGNGSTPPNVQSIFDFLNAWFAGCN